MKYIDKNPEPENFSNWKNSGDENWNPSYAALDGTELKRAIHDSLLDEQGFICCYCGMRIERESSHIEHLKPKRKYRESELEYRNLLASCQRDMKPKQDEPRHCGMKKGDWYEENLMVSPLNDGCEFRFIFTAFGEIYSSGDDDAAARETILRLGLDIPFLNRHRKEAIDAAFEELSRLGVEEIKHRMQNRNSEGKFDPFCFVIDKVL